MAPYVSVQPSAQRVEVVFAEEETLSLVRLSIPTHSPSEASETAQPELLDQVADTTPASTNFGRHAYLRRGQMQYCWYVDEDSASRWSVREIRRKQSDQHWTIDTLDLPPTMLFALPGPRSSDEALLFYLSGERLVYRAFGGDRLAASSEPLTLVSPFEPSGAALPIAGLPGAVTLYNARTRTLLLVSLEKENVRVTPLPPAGPVHAAARAPDGSITVLWYDPNALDLVRIDRAASSEPMFTPVTRARSCTGVALWYVDGAPWYLYDETLADSSGAPLYVISLLSPSPVAGDDNDNDPRALLRKQILFTSPIRIHGLTARAQDSALFVVYRQERLWLLTIRVTEKQPRR